MQADEINQEKAIDFRLSFRIILPVCLNLTILPRDTLAPHAKEETFGLSVRSQLFRVIHIKYSME